MINTTQNSGDAGYVIPALAPVYARLAPLAETLLRVVVGVAFVIHGWPKIQDPLGAVEMVQSIGFYPGWLWATALAATEFFGGLLLIVGLLARPAALATTVVLLVTVWFHWVQLDQGYKGAELSIIWASVTLFFALNGAGRYSVDRLIGRQI
ncbi:DoxX family protein [Cypionkella psychrotolerans]|uniref:DoxX family protein n=1 Tax=Cypionkella psychrotolerans TaxID=1678131 RepID=UPI0006B46AC8|nr:DoxX family protein [Cypionkella psychrotolerans]